MKTNCKTTYCYLLTGDIGGTNSRMALYDTSCNTPLCQENYDNETHLPLHECAQDGIFERNIIAPFLQLCWETVQGLEAIELVEIVACLACAGPVDGNRCTLSNCGNVVVDGTEITTQKYFKNVHVSAIKVCKVINDFVAQGYGCLTLEPHEVRELMPGSLHKIDPRGPKVCVGAGTGLGECYLTIGMDGNYQCYPSEGGHVEYSPRTELQIKLLKFLMKKFNQRHRVSVERVVSGTGLANVYEFLAEEYPDRVNPKVHQEFLNHGSMRGKIVAENAKEGTLCREAMSIMLCAYGSEAGSTAIKFIPTGGLFMTGGVTPKNIEFIEGPESEFMRSYLDKGRVRSLLDKVPLFAVMTEDLGVRGAHKAAVLEHENFQQLKEATSSIGEKGKEKKDMMVNPYVGPYLLVGSVIVAMAAGVLVGRRK